MNRIVGSTCALLLVASSAPGRAHGQTHGWPVQPVNKDHPLGATLGEFQEEDDKVYQHTGIDILTTPCDNPCDANDPTCVNPCDKPCGNATDDAPSPCAFVTVGGKASNCSDNSTGLYNYANIDATDPTSREPRVYRYYHLEYKTFLADFKHACINNNVIKVLKGAPIGRVTRWTCDYNHLHYDVANPTTDEYLDPLQGLAPGMNPDVIRPTILALGLANADVPRWSEFTSNGSCIVVKGNVDIIADVVDRDDALSPLPGVTNIGVYNLRWRACAEGIPEVLCPWTTATRFNKMPTEWGDVRPSPNTQKQFSTTTPWISTFNQCAPRDQVNKTFMVATSSASWHTASRPDGTYTVSVEAKDRAGNVGKLAVQACVENDR